MAQMQKTDQGLIHIPSQYSVRETIGRLESIVKSQGLTVFAHIDFSGDAEKIGMRMRPTQLLIIGNPKAGTPLMVASPTVAIDLPLKALAWEDVHGQVQLSYNSPDYLQMRHVLPEELLQNISGLGTLVKKAVE